METVFVTLSQENVNVVKTITETRVIKSIVLKIVESLQLKDLANAIPVQENVLAIMELLPLIVLEKVVMAVRPVNAMLIPVLVVPMANTLKMEDVLLKVFLVQ